MNGGFLFFSVVSFTSPIYTVVKFETRDLGVLLASKYWKFWYMENSASMEFGILQNS